MICLGIVLLLAIIAILAPVLAPYSYKDQNNSEPRIQHLRTYLVPMSTARRCFSYYFTAARFAVCWHYFAGCALFIGFVGCLRLDTTMVAGRLFLYHSSFSSFSILALPILIMLLGQALLTSILHWVFLMWTTTARLIRGDVMRLKEF